MRVRACAMVTARAAIAAAGVYVELFLAALQQVCMPAGFLFYLWEC